MAEDDVKIASGRIHDISPGLRLSYMLQALGLRMLLAVFALLPISVASAWGGAIGRALGPRLGVSKRAAENIRLVLPEKSTAEIREIVRGMWDNLGRTAAEFRHLGKLDVYGTASRVEVTGTEHIDRIRDDGIGGIFFSAHIGNWELTQLSTGQRGLPLTAVFREANNPYVDDIIRGLRGRASDHDMIPKGPAGARALVAALKRGAHLALLVDQKLNDGIAVPFFGRDAMTPPALAQLALKYEVPIIPAHTVRLDKCRFRVVIGEPIHLADSGDRQADVAEAMRLVNARIEEWIRAHPEQWLWLHRRWPSE